jgi:hypothetical protein
MNLREFYAELNKHPNGGLSGDTEVRVLVNGESTAVSHIYFNGVDLMVFTEMEREAYREKIRKEQQSGGEFRTIGFLTPPVPNP